MSKSTVWRTYRHKTSAFYLAAQHTHVCSTKPLLPGSHLERKRQINIRPFERTVKQKAKNISGSDFMQLEIKLVPSAPISARKLTFGPKNTSQKFRKLSHTSRQNRHNWYLKMTTSFFSFLTIVHSDRLTGAVCSDITGSGGRCGRLLLYHYYPLPWRR